MSQLFVWIHASSYPPTMFRFATIIVSLFIAVPALAHGGKPSFEQQIGQYIVDIGYDRIGIRPGEDVTFDFDLFTGTGMVAMDFVEFTNINLEIARDGVTALDTVIQNEGVNVPNFTYSFPEAGNYMLGATYMDGDEELVYATFDFPVAENAGAVGRGVNVLTYVIAAVLIALGTWVIIGSLRRG